MFYIVQLIKHKSLTKDWDSLWTSALHWQQLFALNAFLHPFLAAFLLNVFIYHSLGMLDADTVNERGLHVPFSFLIQEISLVMSRKENKTCTWPGVLEPAYQLPKVILHPVLQYCELHANTGMLTSF